MTLSPNPTDWHATRDALLTEGRDHFDRNGWIDGSRSPWEPNDREHFARQFAAIAMPLGMRAPRIKELRRKVFQFHRWDDAGMLGVNGYGPAIDDVLRGARSKAASGRDGMTDPYFGRELVS